MPSTASMPRFLSTSGRLSKFAWTSSTGSPASIRPGEVEHHRVLVEPDKPSGRSDPFRDEPCDARRCPRCSPPRPRRAEDRAGAAPRPASPEGAGPRGWGTYVGPGNGSRRGRTRRDRQDQDFVARDGEGVGYGFLTRGGGATLRFLDRGDTVMGVTFCHNFSHWARSAAGSLASSFASRTGAKSRFVSRYMSIETVSPPEQFVHPFERLPAIPIANDQRSYSAIRAVAAPA